MQLVVDRCFKLGYYGNSFATEGAWPPRSYDLTQIDITGQDGNAFALLGYAKRFAKQLGLDANAITTEMMQGDYDHLLDTFEGHFGEFVELIGRYD